MDEETTLVQGCLECRFQLEEKSLPVLCKVGTNVSRYL
jgi:hypothetical protein